MDVNAPQNCTCFNLRKAARAVTQMYDEALKPTGLRSTQVSVLVMIGGVGPLTMKRLADLLVMDRTTLTRNLKPLIADDLVTIEPGEDKRQREVALTTRGRKRLEEVSPVWRDVQNRLAAILGETRWASLLSNLHSAVEAAQGAG